VPTAGRPVGMAATATLQTTQAPGPGYDERSCSTDPEREARERLGGFRDGGPGLPQSRCRGRRLPKTARADSPTGSSGSPGAPDRVRASPPPFPGASSPGLGHLAGPVTGSTTLIEARQQSDLSLGRRYKADLMEWQLADAPAVQTASSSASAAPRRSTRRGRPARPLGTCAPCSTDLGSTRDRPVTAPTSGGTGSPVARRAPPGWTQLHRMPALEAHAR